jgi:hypothetical protein
MAIAVSPPCWRALLAAHFRKTTMRKNAALINSSTVITDFGS